jgi:hypothetical protein
MRRDRLTFAMLFGVPLMQLLLFRFCDQQRSQASADGCLDLRSTGPLSDSIVAALHNRTISRSRGGDNSPQVANRCSPRGRRCVCGGDTGQLQPRSHQGQNRRF